MKNMECYTWIELADIHLAYGATFTSGRAAQRLYRDRYPNCRITHHTTFSSIRRRLCQSGTVQRRVNGQGRGVLCEHAEEPCCGTYVENKVPLALKRSVAAHRFFNKICFNEGYLSGPKACRSNLETFCITFSLKLNDSSNYFKTCKIQNSILKYIFIMNHVTCVFVSSSITEK